jgi:hypothetical protein
VVKKKTRPQEGHATWLSSRREDGHGSTLNFQADGLVAAPWLRNRRSEWSKPFFLFYHRGHGGTQRETSYRDLLVPMFFGLVALRPLDEKHGVKKMGAKR